MSIIKGLILKDIYVFKNYKKNIYFSILIFIFILFLASFSINIVAPGSIIFLVFFGMNSISTFSYDEQANVDRYLLTLPINRKDIVFSKYLFSFVNSFLSLLLGLVISIVICLITNHQVVDLADSLKACLIAFTGVTFLMCSDIPCIYKWGVEKGRMQSVLIPVLIIFLISFIAFFLLFLFPNLYFVFSLSNLFKYSPIICVFLNIFLYLISYNISYYLFAKKSL